MAESLSGLKLSSRSLAALGFALLGIGGAGGFAIGKLAGTKEMSQAVSQGDEVSDLNCSIRLLQAEDDAFIRENALLRQVGDCFDSNIQLLNEGNIAMSATLACNDELASVRQQFLEVSDSFDHCRDGLLQTHVATLQAIDDLRMLEYENLQLAASIKSYKSLLMDVVIIGGVSTCGKPGIGRRLFRPNAAALDAEACAVFTKLFEVMNGGEATDPKDLPSVPSSSPAEFATVR